MKEARRITATEVKIRNVIGLKLGFDDMGRISDILNERQREVEKMLQNRDDVIASYIRKITVIKEIL